MMEALHEAEGFSDLVLAVFLDVRGFSSFAGMAESSEAAIFLRRMYLNILDEYFPKATFFKPTGDGLMVIRHFDRDSLREEVEIAVRSSLRLVTEFSTITSADPMVNFEVPGELGIGITRGAATRLASGDLTLDYSGRPLNLAARLMDLARPSGVVFDGRLIKGLEVDPDLLSEFTNDRVYVKGIADVAPLEVYRSGLVKIPPRNKQPLEGRPYESKADETSFAQLCERERFVHFPPFEPVDPDQVELAIRYPKPTAAGRRHPTMSQTRLVRPIASRRTAKGWELSFDYRPVVASMRVAGVKDSWPVTVFMRYVTTESVDDDA